MPGRAGSRETWTLPSVPVALRSGSVTSTGCATAALAGGVPTSTADSASTTAAIATSISTDRRKGATSDTAASLRCAAASSSSALGSRSSALDALSLHVRPGETVPLLITFVYMAIAVGSFLICCAYARDFMGTKVIGNINIALIFGLLQFVSTFLIAWLYSRYAGRKLDPPAERLRQRVEGGAE